MYYEHKGGTFEIVQGEYKCQIPPVGYGKNRLTGKLEHVGVIKRSQKVDEQYWKRLEIPEDYDKRKKIEAKKQEEDSNYFDSDLEKIRTTHWKHRLCGMWVMINGKSTYLPPSFYVYLNYCQLDVGYPTYRDTDRRLFYVWEYCVEDPRCAGLADYERRRAGKTFKSGSILLDRTSLFKNHHAGLQSKTSNDAKQVFIKTVVNFFKKMPEWFRPVYDQSKGITPTSELRFFQTTKKGRKADDIIGAPELESWIDYGSSDIFYYDGSKLNTYVMDEFGKTADVSVWDRWNVVRFCLDQDGEWCGKAFLTTTVEEMESGGADAKKIWESSNPTQRDANGKTKSGLYRIFFPAYETTYFDKFGMPEVEKARQYYINQREGLKNDPRALSSMIRKAPFSIEEAFRIDGLESLYDAMKLNNQLDIVSCSTNLTERGNFSWKNGEPFTEVEWTPIKNGRWEKCKAATVKEPNKIIKNGDQYSPNNNFAYAMGADPFKYSDVDDSRRSNTGAFVYQKYDPSDPNNLFSNTFVCKYAHRANTTWMQYDDLIKMQWFYGCQALFEINVDSCIPYYTSKGCYGFLTKLPGEKSPGIYSDGQRHMVEAICDYTESYINEFIDRVYFASLITEWLEFDPKKTTPSDEAIGAGLALIAIRRHKPKDQIKATREVTEYFTSYKAPSNL